MEQIKDNPKLEAIVNSKLGGDSGWEFVSDFLIHGYEDNYLLDAETGKTRFDTEEFRTLLRAVKKYCVRGEGDKVSPGSTVLTGEVLCNQITIEKPQQLDLYRYYYGEDIHYIGFPGQEGSSHYINSLSPIAIRKTADREEKEMACAFIQLLLSYDCQRRFKDEPNAYLSVRKDVLEEQLYGVGEGIEAYAYGYEPLRLKDGGDSEKNAELLYGLLEKAKPAKTFPSELNRILAEELLLYFTDAITEEMVIEHLENRVKLYLEEQ